MKTPHTLDDSLGDVQAALLCHLMTLGVAHARWLFAKASEKMPAKRDALPRALLIAVAPR